MVVFVFFFDLVVEWMFYILFVFDVVGFGLFCMMGVVKVF